MPQVPASANLLTFSEGGEAMVKLLRRGTHLILRLWAIIVKGFPLSSSDPENPFPSDLFLLEEKREPVVLPL